MIKNDINNENQTKLENKINEDSLNIIDTNENNENNDENIENIDLIEGPYDINDFALGVTLGTGSFGKVKYIQYNKNNKIYALKILNKNKIINLKQTSHIFNEKNILKKLNHPFIIHLYDTFNDQSNIYLILEYINGGEFFKILKKYGTFDVDVTLFYIGQLILIFEYIHNLNIIYRDLKPENILIYNDGYIKLTDFGFAKEVEFKTYTLCGTPDYIAPEVLLNIGHGKGVDWWSLGVLLYEIMIGIPPFIGDDIMLIYQKILSSKILFPKGFNRDVKSLIKKLLIRDLTKRYGCMRDGVNDIKNHRLFINNNYNFYKILNKEISAPIIPNINSENDTSNFDIYEDDDDNHNIQHNNNNNNDIDILTANNDPFINF